MPLFGPFFLVLSTGDRERLDKIAAATESLGKTAAALLEKLNEPGQSPEDLARLTADLAAHDAPAAEALRAAGGPST
jgi:hypothetical protein